MGYRKRVKAVRAAQERRKERRWEEKERKREEVRWREAVAWRLRGAGVPIWVRDEGSAQDKKGWFRLGSWWGGAKRDRNGNETRRQIVLGQRKYPYGMHLNVAALSPEQLEEAAKEAGVSLVRPMADGYGDNGPSRVDRTPGITPAAVFDPEKARSLTTEAAQTPTALSRTRQTGLRKLFGRLSASSTSTPTPGFPAATTTTTVSESGDHEGVGERTRTLAEQYEMFRASMETEEKKAFWVRLGVSWGVFILFWLVCVL